MTASKSECGAGDAVWWRMRRTGTGDILPRKTSGTGCPLVWAAVAVRPDTDNAWLEELEQYRRPLTGYCYRMLGSAFEADDAVQETIVRAWKNADTFEGRSAVRSWLYR